VKAYWLQIKKFVGTEMEAPKSILAILVRNVL